jgi:tetratricopeptide (TPR) repeat protein
MRTWLMAMLAALFPGLGGAPQTAVPTPPVPPVVSEAPGAHAICSGDTAAPRTATLLAGYGKGGFPITTGVPRAQAFFDNGMQLGAAFAHKASIAAFGEAVRLAPDCAMCLWGEAWSSGPTINYPVDQATRGRLAAMTARAGALAATGGTPLERELVAALALRYAGTDAKAANLAYARAMDALVVRYPRDAALDTLAADAWLIAAGEMPGNSWKAPVARSVALLEGVLARDADYTPAIHFYIHATEFAQEPGKAERYADRLARLAPAASHLVHMPSHTYYWIGRYQDAADANARAVEIGKANAQRLGLPAPDGVWDLPYHWHNVTFGVGGALMSGDAKTALMLSDPLVARAAAQKQMGPYGQMLTGLGYAAEARFADPARVLALPDPGKPYLRGFWHYARGEAKARLGDAAGVRAEAAAIVPRAAKRGKDDGSDEAARTLAIAQAVLVGRAAMLENRPAEALAAYRRGAKLQESRMLRMVADPPSWWYPVRRSVAEALLSTGDARGALREADAALALRPRDPVTLAVRARARAALGDRAAAAADRRSAERGWRGGRWAFRPAFS